MEKREPSYTVGNANQLSHYGEHCEDSLQNWEIELPYDQGKFLTIGPPWKPLSLPLDNHVSGLSIFSQCPQSHTGC